MGIEKRNSCRLEAVVTVFPPPPATGFLFCFQCCHFLVFVWMYLVIYKGLSLAQSSHTLFVAAGRTACACFSCVSIFGRNSTHGHRNSSRDFEHRIKLPALYNSLWLRSHGEHRATSETDCTRWDVVVIVHGSKSRRVSEWSPVYGSSGLCSCICTHTAIDGIGQPGDITTV